MLQFTSSPELNAGQAALLVCSLSICACAGNTPLPIAPTPVLVLTSTAVASATVALLNLQPEVIVLADNLPEPDDLVLAPDGSIYISDVTEGTIKQYTRDGALNPVLSGLSSPEGMVLAPNGSMIVAEQGKNRLITYDLTSHSLTPLLQLVNHTGTLGVDGIILDQYALLVPDSPNGTLLEVSLDGKIIRTRTSGPVRPTGAFPEPDGNLLIADENGNAVWRLHADGTLDKLAAFSIPDDVIEDPNGNIFVITLGDDAIHLIAADTHADIVLVDGLANPQGLIFDLEGELIVTDSGHHRMIKVVIHPK